MAKLELVQPEAPPLSLYSDIDVAELYAFEQELKCGGVKQSWFDKLTLGSFVGPQRLVPTDELSDNWKISVPYTSFDGTRGVGTPKGTALFLKSDVDAANANYNWGSSGLSLHKMLQWANYTLGATCGVGLGYVDPNSGIEPHVRLYSLPPSKMRGAIGWTWGPALARNRRMELSLGVTQGYYILRLFQHEFGHFLGHYGWPSHSNSTSDIMYPSLQHMKAREPNWGYSQRDIAWAVEQFGTAWITG